MDAASGIALVGVVVTLGIAIVGWKRSGRAETRADHAETRAERADERAERAEERADEALELARSAEERADRLEQLDRERHDVEWRFVDTDEGVVSIENIGTDTAHDVTLTVDVESQEGPPYPRQESRQPILH